MAHFNRFNGCHRLEIPSYIPLISTLIVLLTMENHCWRPWVGTRVLLTARSGPQLPGCCLAHTPITEAITTLAPGMPFPQAQSSRSHQDFSAFPYNRQHCASPQAQLGTFTYGSPGPRRLAVPDSPLGSISCHFCEFFRLAAKRLNLSTGK